MEDGRQSLAAAPPPADEPAHQDRTLPKPTGITLPFPPATRPCVVRCVRLSSVPQAQARRQHPCFAIIRLLPSTASNVPYSSHACKTRRGGRKSNNAAPHGREKASDQRRSRQDRHSSERRTEQSSWRTTLGTLATIAISDHGFRSTTLARVQLEKRATSLTCTITHTKHATTIFTTRCSLAFVIPAVNGCLSRMSRSHTLLDLLTCVNTTHTHTHTPASRRGLCRRI